jgi:hypothetical protein
VTYHLPTSIVKPLSKKLVRSSSDIDQSDTRPKRLHEFLLASASCVDSHENIKHDGCSSMNSQSMPRNMLTCFNCHTDHSCRRQLSVKDGIVDTIDNDDDELWYNPADEVTWKQLAELNREKEHQLRHILGDDILRRVRQTCQVTIDCFQIILTTIRCNALF